MPVRMAIALWASPTEWRDQLEPFARLRDGLEESDRLVVNSVKFLGDGALASADHPTAAMLEPYASDHSWHGVSIWDPDELKLAAAAFDAAGFQLHIHGVGDAAVRQALDAVEHTRATNPENGRRPIVAHVIVAQTDDLARFEPLGIVPVMTPIWAQQNDWTTDIVVAAIGDEREKLLYPIGTLARSSVPLSFGSDWPVTTHRPLEGIATAVSRQTATGSPEGGWLPEQRITLATALRAYTAGSAYQGHRDDRAGRLRVGMVADLVQLDTDLFAIDTLDIPGAGIVGTWIDGVRQSSTPAARTRE
jgi:predicted amidohydrolase YtcJ